MGIRMDGEAMVLEVRLLAAWEVLLGAEATRARLRRTEDYFRRYRDGKLRVPIARLKWLEDDVDR